MGESKGNEQRYTRVINLQAARREEVTGRGFYVAGMEINGSAVQQFPGSEIMVFDWKEDEKLRKFYHELRSELEGKRESVWPQIVKDRIRYSLVYDSDFIDGLVDGSTQTKNWLEKYGRKVVGLLKEIGPLEDRKILIGTYLHLGLGVCRQDGFLAAGCMERLILEKSKGYWKGAEYRGNYGFKGGHGWAVVQRFDGKKIVIDPAMNYSGLESEGEWNYGAGYENHVFGVPDR